MYKDRRKVGAMWKAVALMRERLTTNKTKIFARENPTLMSITKAELRNLYNEVFDRLQEYEVAEEQGQIIVPPQKGR